MSTREELHADAFLGEDVLTCGPFELRPFSPATFLILQRTGNALLTRSEEDIEELSPPVLTGVFCYIYAHAAPKRDVARLSRDRAAFEAAAEEWCEDLDFAALSEFTVRITKHLEATTAGIVEPDEAEDAPGKPVASPTGLPHTSPASAAIAAALEWSSGSCGSSPSPEGSNTSTPSTGNTTSPANGSPGMTPLPPMPAQPSTS